VPVLGEFYTMMKRSGGTANPTDLETGMYYLSKGMKQTYTKPSSAARVSFWRAFGITPEEQLILERCYSGLTYPCNGARVGSEIENRTIFSDYAHLLRAIS
jgi:hypothetical protein